MYALVFDFGGVLMKTVTRSFRWAWDDRLGLARGTVERVVHGSESWRRAQVGVISVQDYWRDVAAQLGLNSRELSELETDFFKGDQLDLEIMEFIRRCKLAGQRTALLSNDSPALHDKLERLGISMLFDPLVISADIGVMKPDARAYQHVIGLLGCPPAQTVFVDDMPANIRGASDVGMNGILYTPELDLERTLSPYLGQV